MMRGAVSGKRTGAQASLGVSLGACPGSETVCGMLRKFIPKGQMKPG